MHRHLCKRRSSLPHSCEAFSPRDTRGLSQPLPNKAQLFPPSWEQIYCSDHQGRDSSWEQLWSPHALSWRSPRVGDWSSISLLLALVPVKGLGLDWETGHPGWVSPSLPVPITWSLWLRIWCRQTSRAEGCGVPPWAGGCRQGSTCPTPPPIATAPARSTTRIPGGSLSPLSAFSIQQIQPLPLFSHTQLSCNTPRAIQVAWCPPAPGLGPTASLGDICRLPPAEE